MNDDTPDKPVWLMRDKATMATIQGLRQRGITTAADIARALNDQSVLSPKGQQVACDACAADHHPRYGAILAFIVCDRTIACHKPCDGRGSLAKTAGQRRQRGHRRRAID